MSPALLCAAYYLFHATSALKVPQEQILIKDLFKEYDGTVRPVENINETTEVNISLIIESLVELDLKNEAISIRGYWHMQWKDPFLVWEPADYGQIEIIRLPADRIWIPDIVLESALYDQQAINLPKPNMAVYSDGTVVYPPPFFYRSECDMDIRYYPFDTQVCTLAFSSWTYDDNELLLSFINNQVNWTLFNQGSDVELDTNLSTLITEDEPFRKLKVELHLHRKPLYYIHAVILPSVVISLMSLLIFRLSPDSGEKISLGLTLMLVFHVLLWSVAEKVPESGDTIALISIYLSLVMLMTAISVVMSVIVLNVHGWKSPTMPRSMRWLFVEQLAPLLRVSVKPSYSTVTGQNPKSIAVDQPKIDCPMATIIAKKAMQETKLMLSKYDAVVNVKMIHANHTQQLLQHMLQHTLFNGARLEQLTHLLEEMRHPSYKQSAPDTKKSTSTEDWKTVARVVDRTLFWLFLLFLSALTIFILVVMPFI